MNFVLMLRLKVSQLEAELDSTKNSAAKSLFCLDKGELVKVYTGLPDYATLLAFYKTL